VVPFEVRMQFLLQRFFTLKHFLFPTAHDLKRNFGSKAAFNSSVVSFEKLGFRVCFFAISISGSS
jgi:hypothetical protein